MKLRKETNSVIVHHSLSPRDTTSYDDIYKWHVTERGWEDIGYHFFINGPGYLYRCRSIEYQGAHAYGRNRDSIGICLAGNFNIEAPHIRQIVRLNKLIGGLVSVYGGLQTEYHRETRNKCPGKYLQQIEPFAQF